MTQTTETFDQWAIVEIMGHQRYVGRVTEQTIGGCAFVRVDVPENGSEPAFTKLFGSAAIFGITPVSEEIGRAMAARATQRPVSVYDLPENMRPALTQSSASVADPSFDDEDFDEGPL